jgi:hypothetical protein
MILVPNVDSGKRLGTHQTSLNPYIGKFPDRKP